MLFMNFLYENAIKLKNMVAQLAKAWLGEPDCNAAVPGSIPASSIVSWGAAGIMTVYQKSNLRMWGVHSWVKNNLKKIKIKKKCYPEIP
jgi:hypothetical protein